MINNIKQYSDETRWNKMSHMIKHEHISTKELKYHDIFKKECHRMPLEGHPWPSQKACTARTGWSLSRYHKGRLDQWKSTLLGPSCYQANMLGWFANTKDFGWNSSTMTVTSGLRATKLCRTHTHTLACGMYALNLGKTRQLGAAWSLKFHHVPTTRCLPVLNKSCQATKFHSSACISS